MENLETINVKLQKLSTAVVSLEEKVIVLSMKQENLVLLSRLKDVTAKAEKILLSQGKNVQEKLPKIKEEYKKVKEKLKAQHVRMLYLLDAIEDKQNSRNWNATKPIPKVVLDPVTDKQQNFGSVQKNLKQMTMQTPVRISVADYENSPFVRRPRCLQMQFLDFEAHITPEDFATVPQYLKGRETLYDLQSFLEQTIIKCFTEKYTLLHRKREVIKTPYDLELWKNYKQQQSDLPGKFFITEGDVARSIGRLIDKKMHVKLQILRHLGKLKETRKGKTVYYIWQQES